METVIKANQKRQIILFNVKLLKGKHTIFSIRKEEEKMSLLHKNSHECANSYLDLFEVPPTQMGLEASKIVEHQPISSITSNGPIEFSILGSDDDYLDASQIYLYFQKKHVSEKVKQKTWLILL